MMKQLESMLNDYKLNNLTVRHEYSLPTLVTWGDVTLKDKNGVLKYNSPEGIYKALLRKENNTTYVIMGIMKGKEYFETVKRDV